MDFDTAHLADHGALHTHPAGVQSDAAKHHDELKMQRVEEVIRRAIDRLNASDLPESVKAGLRERLLGALDAGDLSAVALIMGNVATQLKTEEAKDDAADMNMLIHESYPGYAEYSTEGRKFIREQQTLAFERSPELQALKKEYEAMPEAERKAAENEQQENQKRIAEMLHGPDKERYKDSHEDLRIFRSTGLANGPEGKEILDALAKDGPGEFHRRVHEALHKNAEKNDAFVNDYINTKLPEASKNALNKEFGKDGHIDTAALMKEWGKIPKSEKDAAYQALAAAGNDIGKLTPDQQRIVHLANVGIALETKNTIEGAMGIIGRNKELAQALENPNISVEEKMAMLDKEAQRQGISVPRDAYYMQGLKQTVLAINETVEEGGRYDPNNTAKFLKDVGANIKENYDEMIARKGGPEQKGISYSDITYYAAISNSDYGTPEWAKGNKEQTARYEQSTTEWQKIEDNYRKEYGYSTPNMQALEKESMVKLEAQQKAGELPVTPTTSLRELENQSMAKLEKAQAETTVNAPVAEAKPAFLLPPGIDPDALKSLAAAGVTSPQEAFQAAEKSPSNQQNTQVAEIQVGSRLG